MVLDGDHVKPGDRVGVIQSMGIATEVISVVGGVIKKILVEDGQPVEYGQPLISVEPGV
jgi:acetyl-CoA carboxylase biotin carboxyl carrier protein